MKKFATVVVASVSFFLPLAAAPQQSQDVPQQQPGTNNPDMGKQRQPSSKSSTSSSQKDADVPHDKPGTNNPDVAKQRNTSQSKKKKQNKSTASAT